MKKSLLRNRLLSLAGLLAFSFCVPQFLPDTGYGTAFAQTQTVRGAVIDALGNPVIGAGVMIKGTSQGTVTDLDGTFTLNASKGQILEISSVGYSTKSVTVDGSAINVTLEEDTTLLEGTVVVGYGTMARKDVSTSIATVSSKDINMSTYNGTAQLLQGRVTGITVTQNGNPNGGGSISLRGASSLREGSAMEPYYIIDGIPGGMSVPVEDIETIDVLRDASATAIYGSKAANGVIIITTKKGRSGDNASVSYSGYARVEQTTKMMEMMQADDLRSYASQNGFKLPNDEGANTNWQKEVLRTGFKHNHNVSIRGAGKNSQYSASINYTKHDGVVRSSSREELQGRAFVSAKALNDHLEVSANLNADIAKWNTFLTDGDGISPLFAMYYFSPLCPVKLENGEWYDGTGVVSQNYNPVATISESIYSNKSKQFQGIGKAALTIVDGLVWNTTVSLNNWQGLYNSYLTSKNQLAIAATKNGVASRSTSESETKQLESYVTYDNTFKDVHRFSAMAGYSWEQTDSNDGFGASAYNFYNDNTLWYNFGLANSINKNDLYSNLLTTMRMISFYGRLNYSYDSKYIFQASVRRDGSSAFGANNRWGTFPSASFAWRAIQEDFMQNQSVFSDLKFRVGYGVSGNSLGFDAYSAIERYAQGSWFTYVDQNGNSQEYHSISAVSNANPNLKWERTAMINAGIDFGFFDNRITGTLEFYNKETSDLIYWYAVSTNRYPYGSMPANVGNINNKGIELSLTAIPVQTGDFQWRTTVNLSHNKNVVTKMSNQEFSTDYVKYCEPEISGYSSQKIMILQEGYPIGSYYTYEWAGYNEAGVSIFNDYDEDGNLVGTTTSPQEDDKRHIGYGLPKLTYGWNNDISWKKWSLNAFFQGVAGNSIYNCTKNFFENPVLVQQGKNVLKSTLDNQKFTDASAACPSDRYLESGSYLRLATLQLGYNFGKIGSWVNDLTVYATGNNLFTITKYSGVDPEVSLGGLQPGLDLYRSRYPNITSMTLGVKVNF